MITLVEGTIGSGKTYFVVSELIRRFFVWDNVEVTFKKFDDDFEIYTNIDGFRHGLDLKNAIDNVGGIESFFSIEFQRQLTNLKKHIYVIDEAQIYFPRKYYNVKVFNFFQYSRHMGIDVYLITQDIYSLARELQTLNEYHIKVVRRSFSFLGEFRYNYMSGYDVLKRKTLKSDKRVFSQYRSSVVGADSHSTDRFAKRYYLYFGLLMSLVFGGGYGFLYLFTGGDYFRSSPSSAVVANVLPLRSSVPSLVIPVKRVAVSGRYSYFVDAQGKMSKKIINKN